MIYSILIAIILITMFTLAMVFLRTGNQKIKKILQGVAIVLAILAYYCHYQAQARGEYHEISLVVADYVVNAVQYYGKTGIGRLLLRCVKFIQNNNWVLYLISVIIFALIYFTPWKRKRKRR